MFSVFLFSRCLFLSLKILPQKNFYRPNLIFWIVMGCGKAHFGRKGQKTPKKENFGLKVFLMCRLPRGPREQTLRPKFSILGGFLALPTETSFTTPHYYPKYEVWSKEIFFWDNPFNRRSSWFLDLGKVCLLQPGSSTVVTKS